MSTEELVEVVLPGKVEPEGLEIRHGAVPAAGAGQVVIRMEATGVSFAEQQMRRGRYYDQPPFPFVPGYDLVGTVQATSTSPSVFTTTSTETVRYLASCSLEVITPPDRECQ